MIQISEQPLLDAFTEGPPPDPDQALCGHPFLESRLADPSSEDPGGRDPVRLPTAPPFPRVFPGL
jgi:hypothetical protein